MKLSPNLTNLRSLATTPAGFALLLGLGAGCLLLIVGLGPDSLPFPPTSPPDSHFAFSDAVVSHWPNALFLQRSVRAGAWPLWRPLLMSGQPFAANPLNKVWYPPQWFVLLLPVTLHLNVMIWLHLVWAGVGMRAFGRLLGLGVAAASVIGATYGFAPRLAAATGAGHLDIVYAAAWCPWVLWAVHRAILGEGSVWKRGATLGLMCALCFLADVRLSLFVFGVGAVLGVWLMWRTSPPGLLSATQRGGEDIANISRPASTVRVIALALLFAIGLTAVQWLPLIELTPYLSRGGMTQGDAGVFSLQPVSLVGVLFPDRGGFHETMVYVGIPVLILAVIGFASSPRRHAIWGIVALLSTLFALGNHGFLWPLLVRIAPQLLWFRVPSRAWIVVVVAVTVLSGSGLEAIIERSRRRERQFRLAGAFLMIVGLALGVGTSALPLRPGALIATMGGLVATGLLLLAKSRLQASVITFVVGILIVIDLVWMDVSLIRGVSQSEWLDPYAARAQALIEAGVTRVYSPDYSLPQQASVYWNIQDFGGVDPFQLSGYIPEFEAATGVHASGYSVTLPAFEGGDIRTANRDAKINAERLGQWNVSHVLAGFPIEAEGLRLIRQVDGLYLYENTKRPADLEITWEGPNRFRAVVPSDRQDIQMRVSVPGWYEPFLALYTDKGPLHIQTYDPFTIKMGAFISAILLPSTIVGVLDRRKRRDQAEN
jgi:hypothetical protein